MEVVSPCAPLKRFGRGVARSYIVGDCWFSHDIPLNVTFPFMRSRPALKVTFVCATALLPDSKATPPVRGAFVDDVPLYWLTVFYFNY